MLTNDDDDFLKVPDDLHVSDDDDDDRKHNNLLDGIVALDGKKRRGTTRTQPVTSATDFHTASNSKVNLYELVSGLGTSSKNTVLKKQLNRVEKKQKILDVPLSKPAQEKIHRTVAYTGTTREVSKWDPIVEKNRKAEQLKFPLNQRDVRMLLPTTTQLANQLQPRTALELEVAALLHASKRLTRLPDDIPLSKAEQQALDAMSIDEARQKRADLQRQRILLSYQAAKLKRQGKIKSKRYHKIQRKSRQKAEKRALEELEDNDPTAYQDWLRQAEKNRIEERMSLKHKGTSRFMKKQAIYGKYDQDGRQAIQNMLETGQELRKKQVAEESASEEREDEDDRVDDVEDITDVSQNQPSTSKNPWLSASTKRSNPTAKKLMTISEILVNKTVPDTEESEKDNEDEDTDEEINSDSDIDIDKLFSEAEKKSKIVTENISKRKQPKIRKIDEEVQKGDVFLADVDEKSAIISQKLRRKRTLEEVEQESSESEEGEERMVAPKKKLVTTSKGAKRLKRTENKLESQDEIRIDPTRFMTVDKEMEHSQQPDLVTDAGDGIDVESERRMTIGQAFSADDVIDEFIAEKKEAVKRNQLKDIDLTLPGWGDWGGPGIQTSKRKRKRYLIKAPPAPPRRDRHIENAIISEAKDTTIAKLQVSSLPFPFTNVHDFQRAVQKPVGKTWNQHNVYKKLIKPKIVTRLGTIIEPINKAETFKTEIEMKRPWEGQKQDKMPENKTKFGRNSEKKEFGKKTERREFGKKAEKKRKQKR